MADVTSTFINENQPMTQEEMAQELVDLEAGTHPESPKASPLEPLMNTSITLNPVDVTDKKEPVDTSFTGYAKDIGMGMATGVVNAGSETIKTVAMLGDLVAPMEDENYFVNLAKEYASPDLADAQTTPGRFAQTTAQFLTGFVPALKAMKYIGAAKGLAAAETVGGQAMVNSVNQGINVVKNVAGAGTAGAITDLTVFNPYEERISNWVSTTNSPVAVKAVTDFLKADPKDPLPLAKVKNALEGILVGKMLEPVMQVLGKYKDFKQIAMEEKGLAPKDITSTAMVTDPATMSSVSVPASELGGDIPRFTLETPAVTHLNEAEQQAFVDAYSKGDYTGVHKVAGETVNYSHIKTEDDVKDMIEAYTMATEGARGKLKRTWEEAGANASKLDGSGATLELASRTDNLDAYVTRAREFRAGAAIKLTDLAKVAQAGGDDAKVALLKAVDEFGVINSYVNRATGEVARATASMRKEVTGNWTSKNVAEILESHGKEGTDKLITALSAAGDADSVQRALKAATMPNWKDALSEVYINSLFSVKTIAVNLTSNTLVALNSVGERYAGAFKSTFGGSGEIKFREANAYTLGLLTSIPEALGYGWKAMRTDTPQFSAYQALDNVKSGGAFRAETFGIDASSTPLLKGIGKGLDLFGTGVRMLGTRSLMATDEVFKSVLYRTQLKALAQREAYKGGLKGGSPEFVAKVEEVMQGAYKAPLESPYHGISMSAFDHAKQNTFTEELGTYGKALTQAIRHTPMGILIVPFIKTPTNLVKYVGRRTPGISAFSDHMQTELAAGGARADMAHAQLTLGAMYLSSGFALAAAGVIQGDLTANLSSRKNLQELGVQPRSIVSSDGEQQSFGRLDPLSSFYTLAANTYELMRVAIDTHGEDLSDDELEDMMGEIMSAPLFAAARFGVNSTMASGISRAMDAMSKSTDTQSLGEHAQQVAGNFMPFSNQLKYINQNLPEDSDYLAGDAILREASSITEEWKSKIPGLSKDLPPVPDLLGDARTIDNSLLPNVKPKDTPVHNELRRLQLDDPEQAVLGGKTKFLKAGDKTVKLDGVEKWNFMQFVKNIKDSKGQNLYQQLEATISDPRYQELPTADQKAKLAHIYTQRKEKAADALKYDSAAAARGLPRKYKEAFGLWDYKSKNALSERLLQGEASKLFSKKGQYGRDSDVTREEFIANKMDALIESSLGIKLEAQATE